MKVRSLSNGTESTVRVSNYAPMAAAFLSGVFKGSKPSRLFCDSNTKFKVISLSGARCTLLAASWHVQMDSGSASPVAPCPVSRPARAAVAIFILPGPGLLLKVAATIASFTLQIPSPT